MRFVRTAENLFGLPLGFTRIEYLESTGTQYIDTGVIGNGEFDVDYIYYQTQDTANAIFAGTRSSSQHLNFGQRSNGSSGGFSMAYLGEYWQAIATPAINTKIRVQISYKSGSQTGYLNGVAMTGKTLVGTEETNLSIYIFKRHHYGTDNVSGLVGRLYYFKLWKDGVLARDFIPCIDQLGVPCMYDLVGKKPYYNIGTGTFTAGRQVIPVEYLESTGTQYIDTGVGGDLTTELTCEAAIVQAGNASVTNIMGNNVTSSRAITINMSANIANPSPSRIRFGNTDNTTEAGAINLNTFYKYDTNKNGLTVMNSSGTVLNTYPLNATTAFTTDGNILIYKLGDTSTQYIGKIKVKSATIKNSGVLVRDFIPCKDENNVGFMFDTLSGTVYLNAGTGAFSVGENKYTSKLRLVKDAVLLPDGYKRVYYLESTGTQYIDTGFIPTENTRTVAGLYTTSTANKNWFGANGESQVAKGCYCFNAFSATQVEYLFGNIRWERANYVAVNKVFTVDFSKNGIYIDNELVATPSYTDFGTGDRTMTLFVRNGGTAYISGRIYYLKMYDNGVLVRDFIPCLDSNNIPCMYDRVEGKPYYNQGTGEFTYWHTITPVEYLESTGTQYIDTGIKLNNNSSVEIDYQLTQATQSRTGLFGALNMSGSNQGRFGSLLSPSNQQLEHGYGSGNDYWQQGLPDTNIHKLYQKKNEVYFDGTLIHTFSSATFSLATNAYLGNFVYTNYTPAKAKYYRSKWWDNGTLVRSFIPVRDENNVGYMFDEVTGQLFGNAGSGSFGIGNDLPKPKVRFIQDVLPREYRPLKYLESTGTQYIDLGINPTDTYGYRIKNTYTVGQGEQCAIGCMDSGNRFVGVYTSGSENAISGAWGSFVGFLPSYPWTTGTILDVKCNYKNSRKIVIDNTEMKDISDTHISGTINNTLYLFARNYGSNITKMRGKIYSVQVSNGQDFVLDLYPALRKSDNKPGMYDRITKQFFTNDATSGNDFNYG